MCLCFPTENISNLFYQLKCHKYWPDDSKQYGDILVTLRQREFFSDFTVRVFKLENITKDEVYSLQTYLLLFVYFIKIELNEIKNSKLV